MSPDDDCRHPHPLPIIPRPQHMKSRLRPSAHHRLSPIVVVIITIILLVDSVSLSENDTRPAFPSFLNSNDSTTTTTTGAPADDGEESETRRVKAFETGNPDMQLVIGLAFPKKDLQSGSWLAANLISMANSTHAEEFLRLMSIAVKNSNTSPSSTPSPTGYSAHAPESESKSEDVPSSILRAFTPPPMTSGSPSEFILPEAACEPEMRTIDLSEYTFTARDPDVAVYPRCVRVPRCGGCCGPSDLMQCTPSKVTMNNVVLRKWSVSSGKHHRRSKTVTQELVPVEYHDACACQCRVQEKDCDPQTQRYSKEKCKCVCLSSRDHRKCVSNPDKVWNPSNCTCRCRSEKKCSTGLKMNPESCACQPIHDDDFD